MSAAGIQFGRYTLLDRIATGGMAELFLARAGGEGGFEKLCVIKKVLPHLAGAPGFTEMFLDEARLVARLAHPSIVQIFDIGREGNDYFLAMEYLTGDDLLAILGELRLTKRSMPFDVAAKIISVTCEAVQYAHDAVGAGGEPLNIVHRDISPSNIFVTYQGSVKLLDFGIARAEHRLEQTEHGTVKGKQAYMSPEQSLARAVDRRSDVWALGVCLWELLAGRRLFARESTDAARRAVLLDPIPRPSAFRPDVPPQLEEAAMAALEREPEARLASADALRLKLDAFLSDRTYVSSTVQLASFMRSVFGANRIEERTHRRPTLRGQSTVPLAVEPPTESVSAPLSKRRRPATLASTVGVIVALVCAVAAGWALRAREAQPPPPVVSAAPAAAPPEKVPIAVPVFVPDPSLNAPAPAPTVEAPPVKKVKPAPAVGVLVVESARPADVWLDGKLLGQAPLKQKLSPGSHTVQLASATYGRAPLGHVIVRAGETTVYREPFVLGTLTVTVPPWADVFLDGAMLGQAPIAKRPVAAGSHSIRLVNPAGEKSLQVEVPKDGPARIIETIP